MANSSRYYRLALALVAALTCASAAEAQRALGPFGGVLGAMSDADASHTLDLRGSLGGSWNDTLTSGDTSGIDPRFLRSDAGAGVSGSLAHARRSSRYQWQSGVGTSLRLTGANIDPLSAGFSAQTSINTSISRRVSLSGSGSYSYSPYYGFSPGLDGRLSNVGAYGGGFGVATAAQRNASMSAGVGASTQLSRRDTLSASGSVSRSKFFGDADDPLGQVDGSTDQRSVGLQFSHTLTRSLGFHAGYGRTDAGYRLAGGDSAASDSIDVGVDYGDTLRFSRRTAFSFGSSTSAVRWSNETHYRINGSAALTHGFGRSASASLTYSRSTGFDAGFREPLLTDTVSAGFSNQLGRRASWSAQFGYARSGIGFGSTAGHSESLFAGGGLNAAVTRRIGVFTDYSFYRNEIPTGSTVFATLPKFSRQSVTAGLSIWVPLISEKRSVK
jgi:hypothetical protein